MDEKTNEILLNQVGEALSNIEEKNGTKFNFFRSMGIQSREVEMCKFLKALMCPNLNKSYGSEMIVSFIKEVMEIKKNLGDESDWYSELEYTITDGRRIDIALINLQKNMFIPIEAKIYAGDATNQCRDYIDYAKDNYNFTDMKLCYLTIDGGSPSENSCPADYSEQIAKVSWGNIAEWLNKSKIGDDDDNFKHCKNQYIEAIKSFIKDDEKEKIVLDIINSKEGYRIANHIAKNINNVKKEKMKEFFKNLEDKLDEVVQKINKERGNLLKKIILQEEYESDIDNYFNSKKYPRITYNINKEQLKDDYKNVLEDYLLVFNVEVENNLYLGICCPHKSALDNDGRPFINKGLSQEIINKFTNKFKSKDESIKENNWWLGWNYVQKDKKLFNFKDDKDSVYEHLFDEKDMKDIIDRTVKKFVWYSDQLEEMLK